MSQPDADCLFCAIAGGAVRPHMVFEDADLVAFLDIGPIRRGHVQIVPRAHYPYFDDLPADLAGRIVAAGQRIAQAQKSLYGVERVAFFFTGGDIPHAHAHVVPMHEKTDVTSRRYITNPTLDFAPRPTAGDAELAEVAAELRTALDRR